MSEERQIIESGSTKCATINLRSDGILEILFNQEYNLEEEDILDIRKVTSVLGKDNPLYILVVPGVDGTISKEAREMPIVQEGTKAIGIITTMLHQRLLGNLYFKFKKAEFKNYKLFKSQRIAESWLQNERSKDVQS